MVKMPSFDDLKKAGSGLVDKAKAGNFSGMVDDVKSGIDSITVNRAPVIPGDTSISAQFQQINAFIAEIGLAQSTQQAAIRKLEGQLDTLARTLESTARASTVSTNASGTVSGVTTSTTTSEDKKF